MRTTTIPDAHQSVDENIPCIIGRLTWLSQYKEWDGTGLVKGKQSCQFGKLEDTNGNHIKVRFASLLSPVNSNLVGNIIVFQCHKGNRGYTGVKVKINENKDGTRETILSVTKTAIFFEDKGADSEPLPAPRFDTQSLKSMEKNHTNGTAASPSPRPPVTPSPCPSSLTDVFNPNQLIAIRNQAAQLSKETVQDTYLKRLYCELAIAADNLNSKLLNSKF